MIGVDEVGRGCLAGPLLVVAARAKAKLPPGVKDSKLLSRSQREVLYDLLIESCDWGEGWVSVAEINELGLSKCLSLGATRALLAIGASSDAAILLDGSHNYIPSDYQNCRCEPKADDKYPIVATASIIAKVLRDRYMRELSQAYPAYGFDKHVGYGTRAHLEALKSFGQIDAIHRANFKPLKTLYG